MKYLFLLLLVPSISNAAREMAQIPEYTQIHKPFLATTCFGSRNQHEMDQCGEKSLAKAKERMARILAALKVNYKTSEPDLQKYLEKSQASWEKYEVSSCKFETYDSRDGSGFYSIWNECLESKINERISYLSWMLDNP